jgi:VWFA-related protein
MLFKNKLFLLFLFLLCSFVMPTFAQNPAPNATQTSLEEQTLKIDTTLVNVPVVVRDKKGKFLSDLKAEDFVLYENGVKQNVELFATENAPANILIMMESSTDRPKVLSYAKQIARELINKVRPGDNVGIMSFDKRLIANTARFTDNQDSLKEALQTAKAYSDGTNLRNAVYVSATEILKKVPGRKVLVLISSGNDTNSIQSEKETLAQFVETDTVVYSLYYPPTSSTTIKLSSSIKLPSNRSDF